MTLALVRLIVNYHRDHVLHGIPFENRSETAINTTCLCDHEDLSVQLTRRVTASAAMLAANCFQGTMQDANVKDIYGLRPRYFRSCFLPYRPLRSL